MLQCNWECMHGFATYDQSVLHFDIYMAEEDKLCTTEDNIIYFKEAVHVIKVIKYSCPDIIKDLEVRYH